MEFVQDDKKSMDVATNLSWPAYGSRGSFFWMEVSLPSAAYDRHCGPVEQASSKMFGQWSSGRSKMEKLYLACMTRENMWGAFTVHVDKAMLIWPPVQSHLFSIVWPRFPLNCTDGHILACVQRLQPPYIMVNSLYGGKSHIVIYYHWLLFPAPVKPRAWQDLWDPLFHCKEGYIQFVSVSVFSFYVWF